MQPWRKGTKQEARSRATGSGAEHGCLEQPISTDAAIAVLMYRGQEQQALPAHLHPQQSPAHVAVPVPLNLPRPSDSLDVTTLQHAARLSQLVDAPLNRNQLLIQLDILQALSLQSQTEKVLCKCLLVGLTK